MKRLPEFLKKYFWDVEFRKISMEKSRMYILKRILNYGDEKAVDWMWRNFKEAEMKNAFSDFRDFTQKSANYWALILRLPKEDVLCLKKRSSRAQKTFWPY